MILPDHEIERLCADRGPCPPLISPFKQETLQPASVDLTLNALVLASHWNDREIDPRRIEETAGSDSYARWEMEDGGYPLLPNEFILGSTNETIHIPAWIVGRVEGKSSLGRLGLLVHSTAGFIDPGFSGTITLEFCNLNSRPIIIYPNMRICQISFTEMSAAANKPYGHEDLGSKYQGQTETTASRYRDWLT